MPKDLSSKLDAVSEAAKAHTAAGKARNRAIRKAAKAKVPLRKIAAAAGLSHQRVHQIVNS